MRIEFTVYESESGKILWRSKRRILVDRHDVCILLERKIGKRTWTEMILKSGVEHNVAAPYDEVRDALLKCDAEFEVLLYSPRLQFAPAPMPSPSFQEPYHVPVEPSRTFPVEPKPGESVVICTPEGAKWGTLGRTNERE